MATKNQNVLVMEGIGKAFPGVQALENVDFSLKAGEIHALVGENGAGKSTLIKILTGVEKPDTGRITYQGQEIQTRSPLHAQEMGISTVYQEINLCKNLSVAENILIGREPMKFMRIDWPNLNNEAADILKNLLEIDIDVTEPLGSYTVAIQQMVAIARALEISSARILILDEPTSSLDASETQQLFKVMRRLKSNNVGIIFITHFIDQVFEVSDRITVLRNGKLIGSFDTRSISKIDLIAKMIGRDLAELDEMSKIKLETRKHITKKKVLEVRGLGKTGKIDPIDLELHQGEVVGFAGLLGSGRTETANLIFGIDKPDSGSMEIDGDEIIDFTPLSSIKKGIALCPEDRKAEGIIDDLSVRENIVMAIQAHRGWMKTLNTAEQYEIADKFIEALNIATPSKEQPVKNLSGGNQQKVILARWLATNPKVLILDEPTRGIDVGTKAEIQKLVLSLADEGKSCIFISSELEEVIRTSHRIAVLREKKKVAEFSGEVDEKTIIHSIAGSES